MTTPPAECDTCGQVADIRHGQLPAGWRMVRVEGWPDLALTCSAACELAHGPAEPARPNWWNGDD